MQWRRIGLSAYGPTLLSSIGFGSIAALVPLTALHLGADVAVAALVIGLIGVGQLVADLPAGWLAERLGEKRAIVLACLVDACALLVAWAAASVVVLGAAILVIGMSGAVFGVARQAYLTEVVPVRYRARALSTLGGVFRIGGLLGPLAGAGIVALWGLSAAYIFAATMTLIAAAVTLMLPDLPSDVRARRSEIGPSLLTVLRGHARVLVTLGLGALLIMLVRSGRQAMLPLWAEANGLDATQTNLIYAVSMSFDVALFFLGGSMMDRFGRLAVSAPAMIVMGIGLLVLPLTHTAWTIVAVAALLGLGNGISSGIVMTLGSDASPAAGRTKFLAGWRLVSDTGNSAGPLLIAAFTAILSLAAASVTVGLIAIAGAAWLVRVVPRRVD
ncbi:MAG TPA: MFS transporter [Propionibacteriaceae bacterium]|nr:MFS transporter [Propionibacteriaceae bacterium]